MNLIAVAFILGSVLGTAISQVFRWRDLTRISQYINENNRLLMINMDIAEENQILLEQLAAQQGIQPSQEGEKS